MDDIVRLYVGTVTTTEATIVNSTNGVVIKSILICNTSTEEKKAKLTIDGKDFVFKVAAESTLTISDVIVCNVVNGSVVASTVAAGTGESTEPKQLNVFISGIRLGAA